VNYVKTACLLVKCPTTVFDEGALARARGSIAKARNFVPREKLWIQRPLVERILDWCEAHEGYRAFGYLYLCSYVFLLRLPSEALPIVKEASEAKASLALVDGSLVLALKRRKNRPQGSRLVRGCWCKKSPKSCPVHKLGGFLNEHRAGDSPFKGISAACALDTLRMILADLGVENAHVSRTHDFRRGHARDLQASGAPLYVILAAGEWSSPAFMSYLDFWKLEADAVVQAHVDESDEE